MMCAPPTVNFGGCRLSTDEVMLAYKDPDHNDCLPVDFGNSLRSEEAERSNISSTDCAGRMGSTNMFAVVLTRFLNPAQRSIYSDSLERKGQGHSSIHLYFLGSKQDCVHALISGQLPQSTTSSADAISDQAMCLLGNSETT